MGAPVKPSSDGRTQPQQGQDTAKYLEDLNKYQGDQLTQGGQFTPGPATDYYDPNYKAPTQPSSAQVGGSPEGAMEETNFFKNGQKNNDAEQLANRGAMASSLNAMKSNRGTVSPENATLVNREALARNQQGQSLDLMRQAAMGNAPSAQSYQTQMDMNNIMGGQAGAQGAARGLSALGGTQTMGAQGMGMAGSQAMMSGGMGRSKEMADNLGAYGAGAMNMAQGDINRQVQNDKNSIGNAQLNDAWTEGNARLLGEQAKLGLAQGQTDDAWYNRSSDPQKRQMSYDARINAMKAGANADNAELVGAKDRAENDRDKQMLTQMGTGALTIGGGAIGGPVGSSLGGQLGGMGGSYINGR